MYITVPAGGGRDRGVMIKSDNDQMQKIVNKFRTLIFGDEIHEIEDFFWTNFCHICKVQENRDLGVCDKIWEKRHCPHFFVFGWYGYADIVLCFSKNTLLECIT